jgi:hypothetical protein
MGEEGKLRLFDNRVLREIFWHKRYLGTGEWRRLYIKDLYHIYSTPNFFQ